jgi:hypothetical protein
MTTIYTQDEKDTDLNKMERLINKLTILQLEDEIRRLEGLRKLNDPS